MVQVPSVTGGSGVQFLLLCARAKLGPMLTKYSFVCFALSSCGMSSPSWLGRVRFIVLFFFWMSVSMVRQNFLGLLLFLCSSCLMSALACLTAMFAAFCQVPAVWVIAFVFRGGSRNFSRGVHSSPCKGRSSEASNMGWGHSPRKCWNFKCQNTRFFFTRYDLCSIW